MRETTNSISRRPIAEKESAATTTTTGQGEGIDAEASTIVSRARVHDMLALLEIKLMPAAVVTHAEGGRGGGRQGRRYIKGKTDVLSSFGSIRLDLGRESAARESSNVLGGFVSTKGDGWVRGSKVLTSVSAKTDHSVSTIFY